MSRFGKFYLGLVVFLALFWAGVIGWVAACMVAYEAAQPQRAAEWVAERLQAGERFSGMDFSSLCSRFEDPEKCAQAYFSRLEGQRLTCRRDEGSYDASAPAFLISSPEGPVASVILREASSKRVMFLLSAPEWEVASVTPELGAGTKPLRVTIPDCFTLTVNGLEAGEGERSGQPRDIPAFAYAAQYITPPRLVDYVIDGLFFPPEIRILDNLGREAEFSLEEDNSILVDQWAPSEEMEDGLYSYALKNAKNYSNFFSGDLAGSAYSTAPIRYMFPEGSDYLTLAENYRRHDMWMYSPHYAPRFVEERVYGYTRYSEDLFSCVVYLDKKMILIPGGAEHHDIHHTRYYYVQIDGSWRIADMRAVLEEE